MSLTGRKRPHSPDLQPSSYATMILGLANQMTDKNLADAKCWLAVDGLLTESDLRDLKYPSDLFRVLKFKNILPTEGQSLEPILQLMVNINRNDLKQVVEEYAATGVKGVFPQKINHIYRCRNLTDDDSMSVRSTSSSSSNGSRSSSVPLFIPRQPGQDPRFRAPPPVSLPGTPAPVSRSASFSDIMDDIEENQDHMGGLMVTPTVNVVVSGDQNLRTTQANDVLQSPIRASRLHLFPPPPPPPPPPPAPAPNGDVININ